MQIQLVCFAKLAVILQTCFAIFWMNHKMPCNMYIYNSCGLYLYRYDIYACILSFLFMAFPQVSLPPLPGESHHWHGAFPGPQVGRDSPSPFASVSYECRRAIPCLRFGHQQTHHLPPSRSNKERRNDQTIKIKLKKTGIIILSSRHLQEVYSCRPSPAGWRLKKNNPSDSRSSICKPNLSVSLPPTPWPITWKDCEKRGAFPNFLGGSNPFPYFPAFSPTNSNEINGNDP